MPRKKDGNKKEKAVKKEKIEVDFESIKDEIYDYTDDIVRRYYLNEIEKVNRSVIREKNKKILFRNFIITLLLLVIVYLLYLLTTVDYFTGFSNNVSKHDGNNLKVTETKSDNILDSKEAYEPTLAELKESYGYLLDSVLINEKSKYLKDYYNNNLTNELKNYLALNNLDFKKLDLVDNYNMFSDALIKDSYQNMFNDTYHSVSFNYNGNSVRYISKLNAYISDDILSKTDTNIKREITSISVKNNVVTITTVEGIIKDNKLYNILTEQEISDYKRDSIVNYVDKLNKVTYTFDNKKLISIK